MVAGAETGPVPRVNLGRLRRPIAARYLKCPSHGVVCPRRKPRLVTASTPAREAAPPVETGTTGAAARLRVGIDVRYLSHGLVGGVHTYVSRLIPAMLAAPDVEFVLYADAKAPLEIEPPAPVVVRTLPWRHGVSSVINDLALTRWMASDGIDAAFFPANHGVGPRGATSVVTIHDAINLLPLTQTLRTHGHRPTWRSRALTVYLHLHTTRAARRASRIVTMSRYSRDTLVAASGRPATAFSVVYHGAPPAVPVSRDDVAAAARAAGIVTPYVLADGLKNPGVVLRAAERLTSEVRRAVAFVFFARHGDVLPELARAAASGAATLLVRPPTTTLAALYAGAAAFAFPSWVEGFGIPLLEAMTYGAPIIASDRGSIPEVAGDAAIIVDAEDDRALAAALTRLLTDPGEADRLRALGTARVATFTWQRSADETLAAIRRARADDLAERRAS
jgi:glycosyltransferase involved in cell wall biosynthesis